MSKQKLGHPWGNRGNDRSQRIFVVVVVIENTSQNTAFVKQDKELKGSRRAQQISNFASPVTSKALFSLQIFWRNGTVALSLLFDN